MKLNLKQKQVLLENIEVKVIKHDKNFHIVWEAGEATYNGGVKPEKLFTNAQYNEIYRIVNEAVSAAEARINKRIDETNKRIDDLRNEMNQKFDLLFSLLAKNGIK